MEDKLKYFQYKKKYICLKNFLQKGGEQLTWPSSNLDYDNLIGRKINILKIEYRPIDTSYNTNMEKLKKTTCKIKNITNTNLIIHDVYDFQNIPLPWLNDYDILKENFEILELTIETINDSMENCMISQNYQINMLNDKINFLENQLIKRRQDKINIIIK